jgi:ferredoxin
MVGHGQARYISRERMLELLDEADREGLVLQPQNTRDPKFVCLCCGCCCVALLAAQKLARPADFFKPNYYADVDGARCQVCGECVDRCQMAAVSLGDEAARVDLARCIGCGLCVTTCPSEAMRLNRMPDETTPPRGTEALYAKIYRERYGTAELAKAAVLLLAGRKV